MNELKWNYLVFPAVFYQGYQVEFSEMLNIKDENGELGMIVMEDSNRMMVPECMYYRFVFMDGVTNQNVKQCCDHALKKIYRRIDSYEKR